MSDVNGDVGRDAPGRRPLDDDDKRTTIPRPADQELVYRVDEKTEVVGAGRRKFDVPATIAGALTALGTFLVLTSLLAALGSTIGFDQGVDEDEIAIGSLIGALLALFLSCLVGGWVAGRIARHHEAKHGLVSPLWLLLLAAVLAGLGALVGDEFNVTEQVRLPDWFSRDALETGALISGLAALALMLLGGWLGGKLAARHHHTDPVHVVETKRAVRERPGGIVRGGND
jgi:uncharacterized membrane protein